jgi:hypothetical protein
VNFLYICVNLAFAQRLAHRDCQGEGEGEGEGDAKFLNIKIYY